MTIIDQNIAALLFHIHGRKQPLCSAKANAKIGIVLSNTFAQLDMLPKEVVRCRLIKEVEYQ